MPSPPRLLVTGATGHVGRAVVAAARRCGLAVTAAVRARHAGTPRDDGVPTVAFDFGDRATWAAALDGHTRLFLLRPPALGDVQATLHPLIDEARRRGVEHIVFLSVAGAERNRFLPHRRTEDHLARGGDDYTLLRPGFFAQNLEAAYRADIVEDDRLYVPAGRAPVNWLDTTDIGDVAALVLAEPHAHRRAAYTLAGPGPVEWDAVAATLADVLRRSIRYEPASVVGYVRHLMRRRLPASAIAVQTVLHVMLRTGQGARTDPTLQRLLGRPGRTVHQYIRANADVWRRVRATR